MLNCKGRKTGKRELSKLGPGAGSQFPSCPTCKSNDRVIKNADLPAIGQLFISKPSYDYFCQRCTRGF